MRVDQQDGSWIIVDDVGVEHGRFDTSAEAWQAVDRMAGDPASPAEDRTDRAFRGGFGDDGVAWRPGRRRLRLIIAAEIEASRTPKGGLSRKQLAAWSISWPPRDG